MVGHSLVSILILLFVYTQSYESRLIRNPNDPIMMLGIGVAGFAIIMGVFSLDKTRNLVVRVNKFIEYEKATLEKIAELESLEMKES